MSGLRRFDGGYIARGEIVFHLSGVFGFIDFSLYFI